MTVLVIWVLLVIFSILMINETAWLGRVLGKLFRLKEGQFYSPHAKHAVLVSFFKTPFLLALIGLILPLPVSWDWIAGFGIGVLREVIRLWKARKEPTPLLKEEKKLERVDV